MTGDLVQAMRHCPQPVIAAVEDVCAGAGASRASEPFYTGRSLSARLGLAHAMTKTMFRRAYEAFAAKQKPSFQGD